MSRSQDFDEWNAKPPRPVSLPFPRAALVVLMLTVPCGLLGLSVMLSREGRAQPVPTPILQVQAGPVATERPRGEAAASAADVMLKPYTFRFANETPLSEVCKTLRRDLKIRIVIDQAALRRLELKESSTVKLELDDVRFKTGLKLLLDQLDLTHKIVHEDNLLIITDAKGADDPIEKLTREVKAMHEEIHDIQDLLDELLNAELPEEVMVEPKAGEPPAKEQPPAVKEKEKPKQAPRRDGSRSRAGF